MKVQTELTEEIARKAELLASDVGPCECGSNDWHADEIINDRVTVFCDDCGGSTIEVPLERLQ